MPPLAHPAARGMRAGPGRPPLLSPLQPPSPPRRTTARAGVDGRAGGGGVVLNALRAPPRWGGTHLRALDEGERRGSGKSENGGGARRARTNQPATALCFGCGLGFPFFSLSAASATGLRLLWAGESVVLASRTVESPGPPRQPAPPARRAGELAALWIITEEAGRSRCGPDIEGMPWRVGMSLHSIEQIARSLLPRGRYDEPRSVFWLGGTGARLGETPKMPPRTETTAGAGNLVAPWRRCIS